MIVTTIKTSGGFGKGENDPRVSFYFDYELGVDESESLESRMARSIIEERHCRDGYGGRIRTAWRSLFYGDYTQRKQFTLVRMVYSSEELTNPTAMLEEAMKISNEYLCLKNQVSQLLGEVKLWGEANGLEVQPPTYHLDFGVKYPHNPEVIRFELFDPMAEPLALNADIVEVKGALDDRIAYVEARKQENTVSHARQQEYNRQDRSRAAKQAARTRKENEAWKKFQEEIKAQ